MKGRHNAPTRVWSAAELRRMRGMVESGDATLTEVTQRFRTGLKIVRYLIAKHGWSNPHPERTAPRSLHAKGPWSLIATRARAKALQEAIATLDERMAEAKCRRLQGRELEKRVRELEVRDRPRWVKQ